MLQVLVVVLGSVANMHHMVAQTKNLCFHIQNYIFFKLDISKVTTSKLPKFRMNTNTLQCPPIGSDALALFLRKASIHADSDADPVCAITDVFVQYC